MDKLFTLLDLQRKAQEADSIDCFAHIVTNETFKIVPYLRAVFWLADGMRISLKSSSGNAVLDEKSPYAIALKRQLKKQAIDCFATEHKNFLIRVFSSDDLKEENFEANRAFAIAIFKTPQDGILGGLWVERDQNFEKAEEQILSELCTSYAHALAAIKLRKQSLIDVFFKRLKAIKLYLILGLMVIFLLPVRLSVTAPAEIVAKNPIIISAPFDGSLEEIIVQPGDRVDAQQIIAEMDRINLLSAAKTTALQLEVSEANLARLRREALSKPEKKIEINRLESEISIKTIEYNFAVEMIERSSIKSPKSGIAIFADKNVLEGKPMRMGEKIMVVADPRESELLIRVPANAMIPIKKSASLKFFLNVSPLSRKNAAITSMAYQATPDPDRLLTYKIRAKINNDRNDIRIGWKGTAKVYGDRVFLGYSILRRPLVGLRELFGI